MLEERGSLWYRVLVWRKWGGGGGELKIGAAGGSVWWHSADRICQGLGSNVSGWMHDNNKVGSGRRDMVLAEDVVCVGGRVGGGMDSGVRDSGFAGAVWVNWKARNQLIFQNLSLSVMKIVEKAKLQSYWWLKSYFVSFGVSYHIWRRNPMNFNWRKSMKVLILGTSYFKAKKHVIFIERKSYIWWRDLRISLVSFGNEPNWFGNCISCMLGNGSVPKRTRITITYIDSNILTNSYDGKNSYGRGRGSNYGGNIRSNSRSILNLKDMVTQIAREGQTYGLFARGCEDLWLSLYPCFPEEDQKNIHHEAKANVKTLNTIEDDVVGLKVTLHSSLQWTMQSMYEVHDQVMEHVMRFCLTTPILVEYLSPFQATLEGDLEGDPGTTAPGAFL
ncbi:unnamed protein product [Vicia faba]|uniref:Uncharacterized protein n=1 Tax=Vicia faba TaxID=3906 RepID=A0AAV0YU52_VICFA|nr:unnamed protein product [Vicia faba]